MSLALSGRHITVGLLALAVGNVLFLLGWGALYDAALMYVLAVGLPYPEIARSLMARLVIGFVLLCSLAQVAGMVQFFVFPTSDFRLLSLLVTAMIAGLVWALRDQPRRRLALWDRQDTAAIVLALFFVAPFVYMCFWQNNPARLVAFASIQGDDGANHYTMIGEMASAQHLDYRDVAYYPKGFHLFSAFLLHGLHANQKDMGWLANARLYAAMYAAWGAVVGYVVLLLAARLREALAPRGRPSLLLLACTVGPVLALLYLFVFTQEGFLSYFYVVAAVLCAVLYVSGAKLDRASQWPLVAYLLLAFGVAASWGPLLTLALLLVPVLYAWPHVKQPVELLGPKWRWVTIAFALQIVPLYIHLRYARLSSQQGLNATGGLKAFHYGIFLVDLAVLAYMLYGRKVPALWREFAANVLLPFFMLTGAMMLFQYMTVGELRYYAIKTAFLLEICMLPLGALLLGAAMMTSRLPRLSQWATLPAVFGLAAIVLSGVTASPLDQARIMVGTLARGNHWANDIRNYTSLGLKGQFAANTVNLHVSPTGTLVGDAVLNNWANLMQYTPGATPQSGECNGRIFALETALSSDNQELVSAVKDCAVAASARGKPFVVITDVASLPRLRELLGNTVSYLY